MASDPVREAFERIVSHFGNESAYHDRAADVALVRALLAAPAPTWRRDLDAAADRVADDAIDATKHLSCDDLRGWIASKVIEEVMALGRPAAVLTEEERALTVPERMAVEAARIRDGVGEEGTELSATVDRRNLLAIIDRLTRTP